MGICSSNYMSSVYYWIHQSENFSSKLNDPHAINIIFQTLDDETEYKAMVNDYVIRDHR